MTKFLVTNENGDWWEVDNETGVGTTMWIIPTQKLEEILINEDDRLSSSNDIYALDKLEQDIREHGQAVRI